MARCRRRRLHKGGCAGPGAAALSRGGEEPRHAGPGAPPGAERREHAGGKGRRWAGEAAGAEPRDTCGGAGGREAPTARGGGEDAQPTPDLGTLRNPERALWPKSFLPPKSPHAAGSVW